MSRNGNLYLCKRVELCKRENNNIVLFLLIYVWQLKAFSVYTDRRNLSLSTFKSIMLQHITRYQMPRRFLVSCTFWRKERDCALSKKGMAWCKIKSKLENGEVILVFNVGLTLRGNIFIPKFQQNLNNITLYTTKVADMPMQLIIPSNNM